MNFIWINPVALRLYDKSSLYQRLAMQGFHPVECKENHAEAVLAKYCSAIEQSEECVVDMRCPTAAAYLRQHYKGTGLLYPDIHPILVHCALELYSSYIKGQPENHLVITTPCTDLREYGESLELENTQFLSWNEFDRLHPTWLPRKALAGSPIPPGFFAGIGKEVYSLPSRQAIDQFTSSQKSLPELVELLFCEDGCHNGDGIVEVRGDEG